MTRFLLDTNHLGEAIGRVSVVRDQIQQRHRQGDVFGTSGPILCELLVGIVSRKDAVKARSGSMFFCKSCASGQSTLHLPIGTLLSTTNSAKPAARYPKSISCRLRSPAI